MTILVVAILVIAALFNVVTWPTFLRRVARDPRAIGADGRRTRFFTVHLVLVAVALVLSALLVVAAVVVGTGSA
ncbi:SCO4848 family membrane protein [Microbacterium sp. cf332]|uniref:SCO4848 family membrane protein n=1 Tax=Microbacterium sp. cf332 TaxID=1761804 RepID=UPI0008818505|nr:hypothetical protein [Microbacterium sp. cf332]SDQ14421.1 hypothetical protein SAMN04487847_0576 [Microbacterium sp. cf332]